MGAGGGLGRRGGRRHADAAAPRARCARAAPARHQHAASARHQAAVSTNQHSPYSSIVETWCIVFYFRSLMSAFY